MTEYNILNSTYKNDVDHRIESLFQSSLIPIIISISFFLNLGGFPLFDLDEGAFSSATMEMLKRGDFITTYMGGELRFDKPILIYWLQATSVYFLGLNEFSLRLPSAICSSLWIWSIYSFTREYFDKSKANTAIILISTSFIFSIICRAAIADALLNLFICLSLMDAYRFFSSSNSNSIKFVWRAYLWVGFGILAKGPIAIFIPFVSMTFFSFFTSSWQKWRALFLNPTGWLISMLIFLPWYIAEYNAQGQLFIDGFFLKHNLSRFSSTLEGHGGHWFYYIPISFLLFMPASGFFVHLLTTIKIKKIDSIDTWCWCWFFVVFIFFSFSKTQLPHYLLYGATPIFILMSRYRYDIKNPWLVFIPSFTFLIFFLLLPEAIPQLIPAVKSQYTSEMIKDGLIYFDFDYRLLLVISILLIAFTSFWKGIFLWKRQLIVSSIFSIIFVYKIVPTFASMQQGPIVAAAAYAKTLNDPIVMFHHDMPSFSVYLNKVIAIRPPQEGEVLFTDVAHLNNYNNFTILFRQGGIVLAKINSPTHENDKKMEKL